ncbi:unnamed protein product [Calypogeia fissa]
MARETGDTLAALASDARKYVWMGAIPLLVDLHSSEVTSLPAPSPLLVLAPRNGYLPLLADSIKPHFHSALPPGSDTIWFDHEGLPLKWHIPTGVLFDLLCAEPERPWKLTVHFRAYPTELLSPCDGEEAVKWNFINAMKEASYVMYGNIKSVMNMSQVDQIELWKSVVKGDLENFDHISTRLRPGSNSGRIPLRHAASGEPESDTKSVIRLGSEAVLPGRIPVRLYIRRLKDKLDVLYDVPPVNSWDELVYITRPIDIPKEEGFVLTLRDALMKFVPHLFSSPSLPVEVETVEPTDTSIDSHESLLGDTGMPRSYSDVTRGNLGTHDVESVDTQSKPSIDDTEQRPEPETDDLITPGQEGPEVKGHMDPEEGSQEQIKSFPSHGEKASLRSSGGVWKGLHMDSAIQFNGVVRIQGIEPNLDIPLDWVARNLCGPEQFIHICICTWVAP